MGRASQVGMIGNEGISLVDLGSGIALEHSFGTGREGAHVKRQNNMLGDDFTLAVKYCAAGVLGFTNDGGETGAEEGVLHLLDDAGQARLNDLKGNGIDGHRKLRVLSNEL